MIVKFLAVASFLVTGVIAAHAGTELAFEVLEAKPAFPLRVTLRGTDGTSGRPTGVWTTSIQNAHTTFSLPIEAGSTWRLEVGAPGYWAAPRLIRIGEPVAISLLPTNVVKGELAAPVKLPRDTVLAVDFEFARESEGRHGGPFPYRLPCSVEALVWQCSLPVGQWNVRLELSGHAPIYRWDVEILSQASTRFGPLAFRPGASISGWVRGPGGTQLAGADVSIAPAWLPLSAEDVSGDSPLVRHAAVDRRGFFQLANLEPGEHWVDAATAGLVSRRVTVQLQPGEEAALREPLDLEAARTLAVAIDPPVDPYGKSWTAQIDVPLRPGAKTFISHSGGTVTPEGNWRSDRDLRMQGKLTISDSLGSNWWFQTVEPGEQGESSLPIRIPLVRLRGSLTFDGSGLAGRLFFGGFNGGTSIALDADAEGNFEGALPRPGPWPIDVQIAGGSVVSLEDVQIAAPRGGRAARVAVQLPLTRIRGRVVTDTDADPHALILALRDDAEGVLRGKAFSSETDASGAFELYGIPPGHLRVQAHSRDAESDWVVVELVEDREPTDVVLDLVKKSLLRVRLSDGANGIGGATITTLPSQGAGRRLVTNLDGSFSIEFSPGTAYADVVVIPPAGGISLSRLSAPAGAQVEAALTAEPAAGSLVLSSADGVLTWGGVTVPMRSVLSVAEAAGRLETAPRGYRLSGMAHGLWTWCWGSGQNCVSAEINGATEVELAQEMEGER